MFITGVANIGFFDARHYGDNEDIVLNLSICHNYYAGKDSEGNSIYRPMWLRCSLFGSLAESVNRRLVRDQNKKVWMRGILQPNEDGSPVVFQRADGSHSASYEVVIKEIQLL